MIDKSWTARESSKNTRTVRASAHLTFVSGLSRVWRSLINTLL